MADIHKLATIIRDSEAFWDCVHILPNPDGTIFVAVECSDDFYLATADVEELLPSELDDLAKAVKELDLDGFILWVARKRGIKPLNKHKEVIKALDGEQE
jgi:hypothetical protein